MLVVNAEPERSVALADNAGPVLAGKLRRSLHSIRSGTWFRSARPTGRLVMSCRLKIPYIG